MVLDDGQFDAMVNIAWDEIPERFKKEMENLAVVIEIRPTQYQLSRLKVNGYLLGLFEGVPKTGWGQAVMGIQPGKITIFREPILKLSNRIRQLKETIQVVLMHEVAHYFGHSEDDMFIMDQKLRRRLSNSGSNDAR
jgi:predicted Zn-dependent protease with MMP-like domain